MIFLFCFACNLATAMPCSIIELLLPDEKCAQSSQSSAVSAVSVRPTSACIFVISAWKQQRSRFLRQESGFQADVQHGLGDSGHILPSPILSTIALSEISEVVLEFPCFAGVSDLSTSSGSSGSLVLQQNMSEKLRLCRS